MITAKRDEDDTRVMGGGVARRRAPCEDDECLDRLDRLELSALLSPGLAHDLSTPLVSFQVDLTSLARWLDELERAALAAGAPAGALSPALSRCRWVTGSLDKTSAFMGKLISDFSRTTMGEALPRGSADVRDAVETAVRFAQGVVGNRAIVSVAVEPRLGAGLDERTLIRALVNLIVNAAEAFPSASSRNQVQVVGKAAGSTVSLDVIDNGRGVAPEVRERLFQAFTTTRRGERVRGLGLAVARRLLRDAGGDLELASTGAGGSTFRCTLPGRAL
jgi:signal transduction histidine kinase